MAVADRVPGGAQAPTALVSGLLQGPARQLLGVAEQALAPLRVQPDHVELGRLERAGLKHCSVRQGDIYDVNVPEGLETQPNGRIYLRMGDGRYLPMVWRSEMNR